MADVKYYVRPAIRPDTMLSTAVTRSKVHGAQHAAAPAAAPANVVHRATRRKGPQDHGVAGRSTESVFCGINPYDH